MLKITIIIIFLLILLIENEFKHQLENNSEQQALQNIIELHDEETPDYIRNILAGYIKN